MHAYYPLNIIVHIVVNALFLQKHYSVPCRSSHWKRKHGWKQ